MSDSEALYDINNLKYEGYSRLSLVEEGGIFKQNFADQNLYQSNKGTELVCSIQSNQDYVYGKNCYLRMDVKVDGVTSSSGALGVGFLNSNATALFSRFLLEDKSGAEVERVEQLNKGVRACLPWKHGKEYDEVEQMAGRPPVAGQSDDNTDWALNDTKDQASAATGVYRRVCIPLWYFSGLFNEETLIPSMLISGMRFRLSFARAEEAIGVIKGTPASAGGTPVFSIQDAVIMLDTYSLGLSVRDNLLEASQGAQGLPFTYETLYYQQGDSKAEAYTLQINKAVARAQKIWTQVQDATIAEELKSDNLGSEALSVYEYQTRIGDVYMGQQVLQLGDTKSAASVQRNCAELYANNLQNSHGHVGGMVYGSGLADPYRPPSVSVKEFGSAPADNSSNATIVQNVNQSPHVGASGIAINNSRSAEQRFRFADVHNRNINCWLQYCKRASVYPTRTIIAQ